MAPDLAELVLHLVDDRADGALVVGAGQHEGVGDGELVADVEGQDLVGLLVVRGLGRDGDELEGVVGGSHAESLLELVLVRWVVLVGWSAVAPAAV